MPIQVLGGIVRYPLPGAAQQGLLARADRWLADQLGEAYRSAAAVQTVLILLGLLLVGLRATRLRRSARSVQALHKQAAGVRWPGGAGGAPLGRAAAAGQRPAAATEGADTGKLVPLAETPAGPARWEQAEV